MKNSLNENIEPTGAEEKIETKKPESKKKKQKTFVQIINGDFFLREVVVENLGFIFFLMLLFLLIVGKGYYVKQLSDEIVSTQKSLEETTSDYVDMKVKFERNTTREKLLEQLEGTGLKESVEPPKVIRINKKKN